MRAVDEWIAKTDDAAIPPRVKDRIARAAEDRCVRCHREIGGKLRPEFDHATPLILGGQHRESNLQLLCNECHGLKTKLDVKLKSRVAKSRKKRLGFEKKTSRFPGARSSPWKMKIGGGVERR